MRDTVTMHEYIYITMVQFNLLLEAKMDKIQKLQVAVGGDAPKSPASTAPSARVAVPGIMHCVDIL